MSTYLQLCSAARRECGMAGTGPAAVTGQTKDLDNLVNWVASAYTELQNRHQDWLWLRSTFTFNTTSGDDTYAYSDGAVTDSRLSAAIARFSRWWILDTDGYSNVKSYLTSGGVSGERYLSFLPWSNFRDLYKRGTQNNAAPVHMTVDPQLNLVLGPKPDGIYTITGEYQMGPQILAANGDTPEMPSQYHMAIVYLTMQSYAANRSAPEVMSRGVREGNKLIRQLESNQRPECTFLGTLVE